MERDFFLVNQTLLETIRDTAQRFAQVIAKTLDGDVLIVDNNLNVIGKTSLYFRLNAHVDIHCVIGQILIGQKRVIVQDRQVLESCKRCLSCSDCRIEGMIGVPVLFDGRAVGAIALIFPKDRIQEAFRQPEHTADYLESMAELLTDGLCHNDEFSLAKRQSLEKEEVLDCIDEGVVYTDTTGNIQYYNRAFAEMFGIGENGRGENLLALLPHRILREYIQTRTQIRSLKVSLEHGTHQFYGFLSCKEICVYGDVRYLVFTFRSVKNIWADASAAGSGSMVTMEWCRGWLLSEESIDRAKSLAVTDHPVLVQGDQLEVCEIAAKSMCNYSDRSAMGMVNVYCCGIYREFFEQFLFSRFGELQRANHGTIIFYQIENLPLYLQKRLLEFMKVKELLLDGGEVLQCNVRIIATTGKDLKTLSEEGVFLEELYYRFAENVLKLPPVQSEKTRLAAMLDSGLEFYKAKWGKTQVALSREARLKLLNRNWEAEPGEIDRVLELIVKNGEGMVGEKELLSMECFRPASKTLSPISQMEKEKIEKLLHTGYSKVEIAKMLGIGRATLYRKMAEYQLK